jgi:hypothetical protein
MATIDPNIAMGYRPVQIENPLNQLAAYSQIQGAQQGQQLNALKMQEYQRGLEEENKLRVLLSGGGDINSPDVIRQMYGISPTKGLEFQQKQALIKKAGLETTGLELKNFDDAMKQSRNLLDMVKTPEQYIAWHEANHRNPLIGPRLEASGVTVNQSRQHIMDMLAQPGGLDKLITESKLGATKFIELNKPQYMEQNLGGTNRITALPGLGIGAPTTVSDTTKTPTIADKISQARLNLEQDKVLREQTMGTIPAGYRLNKDTKELEAIPGGPTTVPLAPKELQAREAKFPQATTALKTFDSTSDNLIKDLERLKKHPGLSNITGVIAGRTPSLTAQGREAQALYDKIIARGGFQELQSLRQSSPTGGALGNVSNQEGQSLRQAFGALDRTQDASSIRNEIDRLVENIGGAKTRVREAFDMTYDYKNTTPRSNAAAPATPNAATVNIKSNAEYDALPSGTIFVDPNGQQRRKP